MTEPIRLYSTNHSTPEVNLREALLIGQAGDRGLFLPKAFERFSPAELAALAAKDYPHVAHTVLRRFTAGIMDDEVLQALCDDAYDYEVPIEQVTGRRYIMRLDRGPTASFKDFAARMMARWMGHFLREEGGELVILTATSGDTGSAVAHAFHGVERIHVVVLFPINEVSERQRKQMTTLGGNVTTFALDSKFDDCQALVKQAFADPALSAIRLSSANSINIGRLLPQAVYYLYAYAKVADASAAGPIIFAIPSGNFGDMMGAVIAARMGMPIERLVIATNANDEVPVFLQTGRYEKISPSRVCISNAMNVGHPSNLARLIDLYGGWMDETGMLRKAPDMERLRRDIYAVSITDEETRDTIRAAYNEHGIVLEPHGAVGWAGLKRYLAGRMDMDKFPAVSIETAHPAKFPEEIQKTIGVTPDPPPSLAGLDAKTEHYETMPTDYPAFKERLLARFG
jgi:threonine synthase